MKSVYPNLTKNLALLIFFLFSVLAFAQNKSEIYFGVNGKLTDKTKAVLINKKTVKSSKRIIIDTYKMKESEFVKYSREKYFKLNDSTYRIKLNSPEYTGNIYRVFRKKTGNLFDFSDYKKDELFKKGTASEIAPLLLQGKTTEYYTNGNRKSESEYYKNELVSNINWRENGEKYIDNLFFSVDAEPEFKPGVKELNNYLLKGFKDAEIDISSISGTLLIGFVVLENGKIDGVRVLKGIGPTINSVTYELFVNLEGEWEPAKLDNKVVRYYHLFPINFIYKQSQFEFAEMRGSILHWGAY